MTLDEAKNLMTDESLKNLKKFVTTKAPINLENKVNNDILMQALCRAITNKVIDTCSFSNRTIKLLNSSTNTLSEVKLKMIMDEIHINQPNIVCDIKLITQDMSEVIHIWELNNTTDIHLNDIFKYIVDFFKMTPSSVRSKMGKSLKSTIVNNIAQLLSKYEKGNIDDGTSISISTTTRLVNMENYLLFAEFINK